MTDDLSGPESGAVAATARTSTQLQAIRDGSGRKIGYETFYRGPAQRSTDATLSVLAGLSASRTPKDPSATYLYFLNVTPDFVSGAVRLPDPSEITVLTMAPDGYADDAVCRGAARLRARGYGVALDRYAPEQGNHHDELLPLASHVKLDLDGGDLRGLRQAAHHVRRDSNALLIGCHIVSPASLEHAKEIDCDLFQGELLDAPSKRTKRTISGSLSSYVKVLELLAPDDDHVDMRRVAEAVTRDADLSLRVLRACNSAAAGLSREITSIQQAVALLGLHQLRQRVYLAIAQGLAVQGEAQLIQMIEYATLTELVGAKLGVQPGTGFLAGLLLEAAEVLEISIDQLLDDLPLKPSLADEMRGRHGVVGRTLDAVNAYKQDSPGPAALTTDIRILHASAQLIAVGLTAPMGGQDTPGASVPTLPPVRRPGHPA